MISPVSVKSPIAFHQSEAPSTAAHRATPASLPTDTVSLSSPAPKGAPVTGDVDHDGDSH